MKAYKRSSVTNC